jgi:hypothetical protein
MSKRGGELVRRSGRATRTQLVCPLRAERLVELPAEALLRFRLLGIDGHSDLTEQVLGGAEQLRGGGRAAVPRVPPPGQHPR